ncbi:MAG: hypothetical protein GC166_10820 [Alphaproteobacteria bacterium]|nr:hypothetical protein [Alphaproteobacteria bacterium]
MFAVPANAQATRTWISGVGDDANPCSRTAPCKTFAGAISKTAAGGEINCLDPGGFGAVTITKSITLDCEGTLGSVLAAGTNGIVINAAATDVVVLRYLDIEGFATGIKGVSVVQAASVSIEHSSIRNFRTSSAAGISFTPSNAGAKLFVSDTNLNHNGTTGVGGGIVVNPTGTGSAVVQIDNVRMEGNNNNGIFISSVGLSSGNGSKVSISNSTSSGNTGGISVLAPNGTASATVMVSNSIISNNTSVGISTNGTSLATMRVGGTTITGNGLGILQAGTSSLLSYGDNQVNGNAANETFPGAVIPKI